MTPERYQVLIPRPCEYVTLRGKEALADVVKVRDLGMGRLSCIIQVGLKSREYCLGKVRGRDDY